MARKIDKMKAEIIGEVLSQSELENYMSGYDFTLVEYEGSEDEEDRLIKFTNYKSQIWVECEKDEDNNILILNLKSITKISNEPTRVDPFRTYEDLEAVLNYFERNHMYHHWFAAGLMLSLGRRVGDILSLKWYDLFMTNGEYRERLTTLKEEKTGKIVGVKLNDLAKYFINEYCVKLNINSIERYKEKIFSTSSAAFRKVLKQAVKEVGLSYPVSTHSFRKYYANTIYKLHPQDSDNLMIVQTMMGHSDLETTKLYINEIDRKSDKYNYDYADYMLKRRSGEEVEISNSPILSIVWEEIRKLFSDCYDMSQEREDKFDVINKLIGMAEKCML